MARKVNKACLYCGKYFSPPKRKFCSRVCSLRYKKGTIAPRGPNTGRSADKEHKKILQQRRRGWSEEQIRMGTGNENDKYAPARKLGFRSMFEARVAANLDNANVSYEYEKMSVPYVWEGKYVPDFGLGNGVYVECKGKFDAKDRKKMLAVKARNPQLDIRFLFQRASNRITKSPNSMTYGEWATKHGFIWDEGDTIPEEWYRGGTYSE